jgi:hypothetical protein
MAHSFRRRVKHALMAVSLIIGLVAIGNPAEAVHDEGFVLQGDVTDGGTTTTTDWTDLFTTATVPPTAVSPLPTGFVRASFKADFADPDTSAYATGSKDTLPINLNGSGDWECKKSNNLGSKFDLVNAYAAALRVTTGTAAGHLIVYSGSEIASPNGDRNVGMWLLQDKDVDCSTTGGGNQAWSGHHRNGDVFIVSAFTNGGTKSNITVYQWTDGGATGTVSDTTGALVLKFNTGSLNNADCDQAGISNPPINDNACAIENQAAITPPWAHPDADGGALNINEFVESGIDLTGLGVAGCFSTAVINSRSSQEPGSTLHDFARLQFETCGNLTVHKYIDRNMNGTNDDVLTTGTVVQYPMTVTGPSPSTATVCSGSTNSNGDLVCSSGSLQNLVPGTYTVTETQNTGFFNTDPGGTTTATANFNTAGTVTKTFTVGLGNTTVEVGNTCYVAKTFQITNVPSGVNDVRVDYQATGPTRATTLTATGVVLTTSGTVASTTVSNVFNQKDTIAWQWYVASDPSNKIQGSSGESLASGAYPLCAKTNTGAFASTPISGSKFKDINGNGVKDAGEGPLAGFVFDLRAGSSTTGSVLQTTTSTANGTYTFPNEVFPGTYTVTERAQTGWVQTTPTANAGWTFTIVLNQSAYTVPPFGNTPLSAITVTFLSRAKLPGTNTDATKVKNITCVDKDGGAGSTTVANSTSNSVTTSDVQLNQNKVVCTIEYEDP